MYCIDVVVHIIHGTLYTYMCTLIFQRDTFPNEYGVCECTNPICLDTFVLCNTSFDFQLDLFDGAVIPSQSEARVVPGLNFTVYMFDGVHAAENWILLSDDVKLSFLQRTDNFSLSMWVKVESGSSPAYLVAFEEGTERQLSLFDGSQSRLIFYYCRGELSSNVPGEPDDGFATQVSLSFYYDSSRLPTGLRDSQWHFLALTINYPVVLLTLDGTVYLPTAGSFRNQFNSLVSLVNDGTEYEMPAPILVKGQAQINAISGIIGGSQRGTQFSLAGEMRQVTISNVLSSEMYTCMASCNNRIIINTLATLPQETFYNPVTRVLDFNGNFPALVYTALLRSLIYIDNGFLLPESNGIIKNRTIELKMRDEVDFGTPFFIDIIGTSNRNAPVIDLNGAHVPGVGFSTVVVEESFQLTRLMTLDSFICDDDFHPRIEFASVTFLNPQSVIGLEFISLVDELPSGLVTSVSPAVQINITATDPEQATSNVFITALQSVRYHNLQDEPGNVPRQFEFVVSDGSHTGSAISTVTFETFNDVPVLDLNGHSFGGFDNCVEYLEGSPALAIAPDLFLYDPDSFQLVNATVEIQQVFDVGSEMLLLDSSLLRAGVVCEPVSCSGTSIRISGVGSVFDYQTLLRSVQYVNTLQLPNLRDRVVFAYVSDGEAFSNLTRNAVVDIFSQLNRVMFQLDYSMQNYSTTLTKVLGTPSTPIPCHHALRVVDASMIAFESVVVQIVPGLLPVGVQEDLEMIVLTSLSSLSVSIEINTVLKRITFIEGSTLADYLAAIERIRYQNAEPEPFPTPRMVQFTVFPGGGAPEDSAFCRITIETINGNSPMCLHQFQLVEVLNNVAFPAGVHTLLATDADVGMDGQITYTLVSGDSSLFSVVDTEGEGATVLLLRWPDFGDHFNISVEACDGGSPQMCCNFSREVTTVVPSVIVAGPQNITYSLGEDILVACEVTGNALQFEWYRDNELLEEERSTDIAIPSVQPGSRGYYVCVATNAAGTTQSYPGLLLLQGTYRVTHCGGPQYITMQV